LQWRSQIHANESATRLIACRFDARMTADARHHCLAVAKMNAAAKAKSKPAGRRWPVLSRDMPAGKSADHGQVKSG
jgi:hypothetical protein